jgi:hypothetical protein
MDLEPQSPTSATSYADTAFQTVETDCETSNASCNNSPRNVTSHTASVRARNAWPPAATQAGYFVFPDPLLSGRGTSNSLENARSHDATLSENELLDSKEEVVTELRISAQPDDVPFERSVEPESTPSDGHEGRQFLPLLEDDPNYPKNPALNPGLEKINRRLTRVTLCPEKQYTQSDGPIPIPKNHPAFREADPSSTVGGERLAALQAQVEQLKADLQALKQSASSKDSRGGKAIKRLDRNQDRLVDGSERMRTNYFR